MKLTFKTASETELEEIYELAGVNRREATNHVAEDNRQRMIEAYEHSAKYGAYFRCLMDGETLVGWVYVDKAFDYLTGEEIGWISDIYVKPSYRGQGLSKLLIDEALKEFKDQGYPEAGLNVYVHNDIAMSLYEKMGFRDVNKFMKRPL
ncbi:GNAT family N-acetyltransferase [Bacillus sp. EB01]|uniref:GNAT family N-acetyltransferase n=1 Tax=Bacillus sp. EB01 TaxID=1347086 RepID=UPI0005C6881B|nr:GNAT family N-acetyltransferase [Bacillus sp. EB01]